eukprot:PhM_4_TR19108/c0_g1_i1/m.28092
MPMLCWLSHSSACCSTALWSSASLSLPFKYPRRPSSSRTRLSFLSDAASVLANRCRIEDCIVESTPARYVTSRTRCSEVGGDAGVASMATAPPRPPARPGLTASSTVEDRADASTVGALVRYSRKRGGGGGTSTPSIFTRSWSHGGGGVIAVSGVSLTMLRNDPKLVLVSNPRRLLFITVAATEARRGCVGVIARTDFFFASSIVTDGRGDGIGCCWANASRLFGWVSRGEKEAAKPAAVRADPGGDDDCGSVMTPNSLREGADIMFVCVAVCAVSGARTSSCWIRRCSAGATPRDSPATTSQHTFFDAFKDQLREAEHRFWGRQHHDEVCQQRRALLRAVQHQHVRLEHGDLRREGHKRRRRRQVRRHAPCGGDIRWRPATRGRARGPTEARRWARRIIHAPVRRRGRHGAGDGRLPHVEHRAGDTEGRAEGRRGGIREEHVSVDRQRG